MIEINPNIADAEILFERVKNTAKMKNIPQDFYGDTIEFDSGEVDINKLHELMIQVYQNLQMMNTSWVIEEKPLVSSHPIVGSVIVFCKRVYRKLTRWLFQAYYQQQTQFNGAATRTISEMIKVQEMLIQVYERKKADED